MGGRAQLTVCARPRERTHEERVRAHAGVAVGRSTAVVDPCKAMVTAHCIPSPGDAHLSEVHVRDVGVVRVDLDALSEQASRLRDATLVRQQAGVRIQDPRGLWLQL